MAKKRNIRLESKPQHPEMINNVLEQYNQLSDHDKGLFLQKAGVFFLHHRFRPLSPTPELRGIINNLSRLSFLINTMMYWASIRRIDVEELAIISKSRMDRDIVQPVVQTLQAHCLEIEKILFGDSSDKSDESSDESEETKSKNESEENNEKLIENSVS